jgi:hypothetical protein
VFQGEERSTREVRVVRHNEGGVRLLDVQACAVGI